MLQPLLRSATGALLALNLVACATVTKIPKTIKTTTRLIEESQAWKMGERGKQVAKIASNADLSFTPLDEVWSAKWLFVKVANSRVKKFANGFHRGAAHPEDFLGPLQLKHPELRAWFAAPQKQRIFIIGSHKDAAEIALFRQQQLAMGNHVFFYQHCTPLCSDEEVGAMFAAAGQRGLWYSWNVQASEFIALELARAKAALGQANPIEILVVVDVDSEVIKTLQAAHNLPDACHDFELLPGCQ